MRLVSAVEALGEVTQGSERRDVLHDPLQRLKDAADERIGASHDRSLLMLRIAQVEQLLADDAE